jgi:hypothetical protein
MTLDIYAGLFGDDLDSVAEGIDRLRGASSSTNSPADDDDQERRRRASRCARTCLVRAAVP